MPRRLKLLSLLLFVVRPAHAWRDTIESVRPEKAVEIDGRATEWSDMPFIEVGGLSLRAMNDASNLYLLIRGANPDGRSLLGGSYRQNVTIWLLKADHKSKSWGINLDFSRAHPPEPEMENGQLHAREIISLSDMGITPERVVQEGLEVSTSTFSPDFAFQADLSSEHGRQPIYEIRIPLTLVDYKGRSIYVDLVSSDISPQVKAELQGHPSEGETKSGSGHGGRHGHGGGGGGHGGPMPAELPKPIHLQLTVRLSSF